MKYRIMIVEDEPPTMRNIERSLSSCGVANIELVAKAANGVEALAMMPVTRPHIVLSDVRMPVMDGFGLVERLRDDYPDVQIAILSGFQEFDYVKKALQYHLTDYLLKPLKRDELVRLLEKMKIAVDASFYQRTADYLAACIAGRAAAIAAPTMPDTVGGYCVAVCNAGVYLQLAAGQDYPLDYCLDKDSLYRSLASLPPERYTWAFEYGGMNRLIAIIAFVCPIDRQQLEHSLADCVTGLCPAASVTVCYSLVATIAEMPRVVQLVNQRLEQALLPAQGQLLSADDEFLPVSAPSVSEWEQNNLLTFLRDGRTRNFIFALSSLLERLVDDSITQQNLQRLLGGIVSLLRRAYPDMDADAMEALETIPSEAICANAVPAEIIRGFCNRVYEFILDSKHEGAVTTVQAIRRLGDYLQRNFATSIELHELATSFGISHTYLSTLFRREYGMTPIKYLLTVRIKHAKFLICADRELSLKEIAAMVGYDDPHYFSRIFRTATGVTPSQYRIAQQEGK